jgi:ankyrin repeat protein
MDAVARKQTDISHIYRMMYEGEEDLNQRTIHGFTPLAVATASGDAELVVLLLERRANPAISSIDKGEVPLHHAAFYGRSTVVRLLIGPTKEAGALDATSTSGLTALMVAARVNNLEGLKAMLIAGASASSTNALHGGATALHDAVAAGHFEVAETLLDYEADVNALDMQSRGPLFAASRFCALDCVGLLLRYKADANAQDRQGIFPLDLVPLEHPLREKVVQLLCAYAHQPPVPFRGDARFDLKSKTLGELI